MGRRHHAIAVTFTLLGACVAPAATTCEDGTLCSSTQVCAPAGGACVDPAQVTACERKLDGEACALTGIGVGTCAEGVCVLGGCGNDVVEPGEACDDGNDRSGDGCRGDCAKVEVCGDQVVDAGEACDDGNANSADGCDLCVTTAWHAEALLRGAVPATEVQLTFPQRVAVDRAGNLYIADTTNQRVRRLGPDGAMTTVAGTGATGFSGDGGAATAARFNDPSAVAVDGLGNIYIADKYNHRVRRVGQDGTIATVAGSGAFGFGGDGGPATAARLWSPTGLAVDGGGNLYIADTDNHRLRRVALDGTITTVAGTGTLGFSGDGGLATAAQLRYPSAVVKDAAGRLYIVDSGNQRIRRVAVDGTIATIAGTGASGFSGDGGQATAAQLWSPSGVAVDDAGNVYIADAFNQRIRRVDVDGTIATIAGTGVPGFGGDGGAAMAALLQQPSDVALDGAGNLYVVDFANHRVRRVSAAGQIATVAGTGATNPSGDGGAATAAKLNYPHGVAVDGAGRLYIAERDNQRIRRVDADGAMTTIAGIGTTGFSGDDGPATAAQLWTPSGVAVDGDGNVYIADTYNQRVRRVAADGTMTTLAGTGIEGSTGDGGPASAARLRYPSGVAVDGLGNVYIADTDNHRIRRVAVDGTITTVAGTGTLGFSGDGGPATEAQLNYPQAVAVDAAGALYVADQANQRVRRVAVDGTITTVAGTGTAGSSGDGGPATAAQLQMPAGVAVDALGNLYIADRDNRRIRRVAVDGGMSTVAGTGVGGTSGDGAGATGAQLWSPSGVAVDGAGNVYIADTGGSRIRRMAADGIITTVAGQVDVEGSGPAQAATLASPMALEVTGPFTLFAGGAAGVVQAIRAGGAALETLAGRYPHAQATGVLARYRNDSFGSIGGVAYDGAVGAGGGLYLSESSASRLHLVTIVDPADQGTWTITALGAGSPGFADGALATARFRAPGGAVARRGDRHALRGRLRQPRDPRDRPRGPDGEHGGGHAGDAGLLWRWPGPRPRRC
jgi:cysteine-rich repeat protein